MEIQTRKVKSTAVAVPGSKSDTHRTLIGAALSEGVCTVNNPLRSEDTLLTLDALKKMGATVEDTGQGFIIHGLDGRLRPYDGEIYLANAGTSMRLLAGVAALGEGKYTFTGTERMHERPIGDLLDTLGQLGIPARSRKGNGCPPVEISGGPFPGRSAAVNCTTSSQYLSALLLMAPCTPDGLEVTVSHGPVSKPYIDMTVSILGRFGIQLEREGYVRFNVPGGQTYRAGTYQVEADCSQAGYFWAAAALTGARIKVLGISRKTVQGDVRLADVFGRMGCRVHDEADGIAVQGGELSGITVNMADMPDMVPTLAVVAAFARGTTVIRDIAHLKAKECDRLNGVAAELEKMGVDVTAKADELVIRGGNPVGAKIDTYGDHRMAMSFAVAGLRTPGVIIEDEKCVDKSFPDFWKVLDTIYA